MTFVAIPSAVPLLPLLFQFTFVVLVVSGFFQDALTQLQTALGEDPNDNDDNHDDIAAREAKLKEIVQAIQNLPMEEFVPETSMDQCTISQLKKMLEIRDSPKSWETMIEKQELIDAIQTRRNYCETCCICCEEYQQGDPLRILPKCRHEFHVECMDQWAYSFANKAKRRKSPTCPLCNQAFLQS